MTNQRAWSAVPGWEAAFADLADGVAAWRIWGVLAYQDIRQRYKRSLLGEFWLSISLAVSIITIGIVYGAIFRSSLDFKQYLPYLAAGFAGWTMLSTNISESSQAFIYSDGYLRNLPLPKSTFIFRVLMRNTVVFGHNLIVVFLTLLVFQAWPGQALLLLIPNLMIVLLNCFWIGLLLAILSTRFRDLPPIITSILQLLFLVTPIIWIPQQLPGGITLVVDLNIFASLLALLRDPILGTVPPVSVYVMTLSCAVFGFALTFGLLARTRRQIVFWL